MASAARKLIPFGDRVLVKRVLPTSKSAGGILLPDSGFKKMNEGVVVAVGAGLKSKDGNTIPVLCKVGDRVLLPEYGGNKVELSGAPVGKVEEEEHVLFRDEDILGRLE